MNIILVQQDAYDSQNHLIAIKNPRQIQHILGILKKEEGDLLDIGILNQQMGTGRIITINDHEIMVEYVIDKIIPPISPIHLVLALPRPQSLKKVLFSAVCMGIKKIDIIQTAKVDKGYWTSPLIQKEGWREVVELALEQSEDVQMPQILFYNQFRHYVENQLPVHVKNSQYHLLADPTGQEKMPFAVNDSTLLAIGPEGGFTPQECQKFETIGFTRHHFGSRILRVEDAVSAILGRLYWIS